MVIQKGQRRADGEAVQPQRHLRQFHGQGVLVHSVDAALEHHPPDDGLIGELRLVHHPVRRLGSLGDVLTDCGYPLHQG